MSSEPFASAEVEHHFQSLEKPAKPETGHRNRVGWVFWLGFCVGVDTPRPIDTIQNDLGGNRPPNDDAVDRDEE